MTIDPSVQFLENLLTEAGITDLPADYKEQYMLKLQDQLNQRIGQIIMENLDEQGSKELSDLLDKNPDPASKEMKEFFMNKSVGLEEKIKDSMIEFAQQFLSAAKK